MNEPAPRPNILLVAASALVVLASIALITLHLLAERRGRTIEQALQARWNMPILLGALAIIVILWAVWALRNFTMRHPAGWASAALALLLVGATTYASWTAITGSRDLSVTNMVCDAEMLRTTGGDPLAGCEAQAVDTIVVLNGVESRDQWAPDTMTDNTFSTFDDLPAGSWDVSVTVDGPPSTTAVHLIGVNDETTTRIGTLNPQHNAETGMREWRGVVRVPNDIDDVRALFFASAGTEAPAARIRLDVRACHGQTLRTFDATSCDPLEISTPLVQETTQTGARTWRYPMSDVQDNVQILSNLEVRTYSLQPDYATIQMLTQSTDVLIIPAAMEQTEGNSITRPGESTFEIEIDGTTGELVFVVYIFPAGPTYAQATK